MHAPSPSAAIVSEATHAALRAAITQVNQLLLGKEAQVQRAFTTLLAAGHLLVEDLPGLGKTTLARAMAATLGLEFQRLQFTADLMPGDILGVSVFDQAERGFRFHPGPVFTQLLLADEINRAPPRTQSALLEAMAEQQVTVDGTSHALPRPFFVIATQNPVDLTGTFPLPDSQLDRFLMCISLGYPEGEAELAMLGGRERRQLIAEAAPKLDAAQVRELQHAVERIHASDTLLRYLQALLQRSRRHPGIRTGLSPRAGLALLRAARAHALLAGRDHVRPDDLQAMFVEVAAHRLVPEGDHGGRDALARAVLQAVPVD